MIRLTVQEQILASKIAQLKEAAGSHSPSIFTIAEQLLNLNVQIDACFLSNPYATDLFLEYLKKELVDTNKLRDVLEFYPSQNEVIAAVIGKSIRVNRENIVVGNGAVELIQAIFHRFIGEKVIVNIPTFSSYYEFALDTTQVYYYQLKKEENYELDVEDYITHVKSIKPDSVVIINPNNPNGGYLPYNKLRYLLNNLKEVKNIIIDESFIHFAFEDTDLSPLSATELFKEYGNVIVIKSMSKDFGIAGIRCGYAVMDKHKVSALLKNGFLWNSNGLSEYFFRLNGRDDFFYAYEKVRKKYIKEALVFFNQLESIPQIRVYPSKANFALIELLDGTTSADFISKMLIKYGIYTRTGSDKIGLNGEFIRIASRKKEENKLIINSIKQIFAEDVE